MYKILGRNINKENLLFSGNSFFLIGVFLLPTALPISVLFLIISLTISISKKNYFSLNDKWNYPIYFSVGLILFSCINISLINKSEFLKEYNYSLIWLNLFNWLPILFLVCGLQSYVETQNQRIKFAKYIVSGTIPVLFSFIFQKFFNWYGPYKTFYGLIIWFQKPILNNSAVAGLFSNQNYAGIWLALVLPFSIYLLQQTKTNKKVKFLTFIICIWIIYSIFLTLSRNAFLGILITIITLYGFKKLFYSLIIFLPLFIFNFPFGPFQDPLSSNNFTTLADKFMQFNFFAAPRMEIWKSALSRIFQRPFWGWGASTFEKLHIDNNTNFKIPKQIINATHSHNMPLELAHNFGIPLAIILIFTIVFLLIISWKRIFSKDSSKDSDLRNSQINKIWFSSSLIVFISHLTDVTYYDGKISILISILFAGLRCIINEKKDNFKRNLQQL